MFVDASYAANDVTKRSHTGLILFIGPSTNHLVLKEIEYDVIFGIWIQIHRIKRWDQDKPSIEIQDLNVGDFNSWGHQYLLRQQKCGTKCVHS